MPPRIPTQADFAALAPALIVTAAWPDPPESTVAILVLLHGLGDREVPFAEFARRMALPGVLGVAVRGTSVVPGAMLGEPLDGGGSSGGHFHWGDDLVLDPRTGDLDDDPGFEKAADLVMEKLVRETLVGRCGWELSDVMLFGFGQGGALALGLASRVGPGRRRVADVGADGDGGGGEAAAAAGDEAFKGVVSIGGPLPTSMVPTLSARPKARTPVLLCQVWDADAVEAAKREFAEVEVVKWKRQVVAMPGSRDEMFPIMRFFAQRLQSGW